MPRKSPESIAWIFDYLETFWDSIDGVPDEDLEELPRPDGWVPVQHWRPTADLYSMFPTFLPKGMSRDETLRSIRRRAQFHMEKRLLTEQIERG